MKRILTLLLVLCLCLLLAAPALADAIWEPEDDFYQTHREECRYVNRAYYADGEEGSVTVCRSPEDRKELASAQNGELFNVSFVWEGGEQGTWGVVVYGDNWRKTGWVPMSDMRLKYDSISFREEFGSEFRNTKEELKLGDYPKLQIWSYPRAEAPMDCFTWDENWSAPEDPLTFETVYEDPAGLRWGAVGYFYGLRDFWVCLNAPDAEDPWATLGAARPADPGKTYTPAPAPAPAPSSEPEPAPSYAPGPAPTVVPSPQTSEKLPWLPAGLTAGAVVIAGALLAAVRRKK